MSTLLAGPWWGEFGWEVATWIPAVRSFSRSFDRTVIICKKGHEYLYQDFADACICNDKKGLPDRWLLNGKKVQMLQEIRTLFPTGVILLPRENVCSKGKREYIKYGMKCEDYAYDLVIHARAQTKYNQRSWNWPVPRYRKLLNELNLKKVCSIGTVAQHIEGTEDLRGISIGKLCNILASSKAFLSPSSGPAHLASLCGCPHVIMTSDTWQKSIKGTNKDRYKKIWNPFGTPCKVLDKHNWQPPVKVVVKAVEKFL